MIISFAAFDNFIGSILDAHSYCLTAPFNTNKPLIRYLLPSYSIPLAPHHRAFCVNKRRNHLSLKTLHKPQNSASISIHDYLRRFYRLNFAILTLPN